MVQQPRHAPYCCCTAAAAMLVRFPAQHCYVLESSAQPESKTQSLLYITSTVSLVAAATSATAAAAAAAAAAAVLGCLPCCHASCHVAHSAEVEDLQGTPTERWLEKLTSDVDTVVENICDLSEHTSITHTVKPINRRTTYQALACMACMPVLLNEAAQQRCCCCCCCCWVSPC
jgi:Mrp family chromosome partitioning ATPase